MIPAIREARRRSRSPVPTSAPGFCKREVRECLSLNVGHLIVSRSASAAECWENARRKHRTADPADIPRGSAAFWLGGSEGNGHTSLPTGRGGHWTTDVLRSGFFDRTGIARVSRSFSSSLHLVGWVEDFDGVDIWHDGKPLVVSRTGRAAFARVWVGRTLAGLDPAGAFDVEHEVDDREVAHGWEFDASVGFWRFVA